MPFVVNADLNEAHDQAMEFWNKLTKKQDRRLYMKMENQLSQSLFTYGHDTYSSKCQIIQGSDFTRGEELPAGKVGLCTWQGSIRITGVIGLYMETHGAGGHTPDGQPYPDHLAEMAREVLVFKAYSLVSRAGTNVAHAKAQKFNGFISKGNIFHFDHSLPDGGLGERVQFLKLTGGEVTPAAQYFMQHSVRDFSLRNYSENCYDITDERDSFGSEVITDHTGKRYEITNDLSGRHYVDSVVKIKHPEYGN